MLGNNFWKTLLRFLIGSVLAVFVVAGALFIYGVFFDVEVWQGMIAFRAWIAKPEFVRWQKLLPFAPFAVIFVVLALWREAEKLNLKLIGRALIVAFLGVVALDAYFKTLTGARPGYAPILELEFISNGAALTALVDKLRSVSIEGVRTALDGMRTALWLDTRLRSAVLRILTDFKRPAQSSPQKMGECGGDCRRAFGDWRGDCRCGRKLLFLSRA
jgi:hypothetical protein